MKKLVRTMIFISVSLTQYAHAKDFSVYCTNNQGEWKWLHEKGSIFKKEKIGGEIVEKKLSKSLVNFYVSYLRIDGTNEKIRELQQKCMTEHGSDYRYPQASKGLTSDGHLLGISNMEIYPGNYKVYTDIAELGDSVDSENYFNSQISNIDQLFRY